MPNSNSISSKIVSPLGITLLLFIACHSLTAQTITGKELSFRSTAELPRINVQLILPGQETTGRAADGLAVYYSKDFDNKVSYEDSYKFINPDENLGILRDGQLLSIEGRKPITSADTIPMKVWKLRQTKYTLKIITTNFSAADVSLHDSYLLSDMKLDNNQANIVLFTLNSDSASFAADRFSIIFSTKTNFTTLPVEVSAIKAYQKNKGVEVAWTAENESNIGRYEVERSSDGSFFITAGTVKANNSAISSYYSFSDVSPNNGDSYYRVKSFDKSGEIKYSTIVKVQVSNALSHISVAANPGQTNAITLSLKNSSKGNYGVNLINYSGQTFYAGNFSHSGGSLNQQIKITSYLPSGLYRLQVLHDGKKENLSLLF